MLVEYRIFLNMTNNFLTLIHTKNSNMRGKQTMLYFKRVAIFRSKHTEIKASVMLFTFSCFYITNFWKRYVFYGNWTVHVRVLKTMTFKIFISSSVNEYLLSTASGVNNHLSRSPGQVKLQAGQAYIFTQCPGDK